MFVHPQARGSLARIAVAAAVALVAALAVMVMSAQPASAGADAPAANAAAKRCAPGKVLVRRPGRSSVCAKPCPSGKKRKVSSKGRVSCVKRRTPAGPPSGPGGPPTTTPPGSDSGPTQGGYSGETEQSRPVTFTISGGQVTNFEAGVNTYCTTMYNQRTVFDAIANVPPMDIGPDGSFSYTGDENNGNIDIKGQVSGGSATGTVGMFRGDTNYSGGQMYYGGCSASDIKWSATAG